MTDQKELLHILSDLIKNDNSNPPGNEYTSVRIVERFFRKYGIEYKKFEAAKGRQNIVGYIGKGKPRIFIACHLDTVPAGDGWETNPFNATIKNGKVYGRGSSDNKGPMVSILVAAKKVKAAEKNLKGQVMIAGVADEEKGSTFGVKFLLNKNLVSADYAIIPDIGNRMKKISVAEKGHLVLKITSYGKQAHGSRPADGINAITNMVDFLNLVKNYKMKFEHHKLLSDPTINIGKISGGVAVNVVPGECEVLIDIRYLPSQSSEKIVNDFRKMLSAIKKNKARFGLKITEDQKPTEISEKNPMVKSIIKCSRKFGVNPQISGISGTTVSKLFINKSIPSVGFGPGSDCAHMANEFVEISDLEKFSEILYAVVTDLMC